MVNININIPEDKKEIITAFNALINAFKNDIEVKKEKIVKSPLDNNRLEEFKKQFGDLKYEVMPTKEDLDNIRANRYVQ